MGKRDRRTDIVLYDSDYGFAMNIVRDLYLGPGEPGPGDTWKFPAKPAERDVESKDAGKPAFEERPHEPTASS